jgi:hypothetical protein
MRPLAVSLVVLLWAAAIPAPAEADGRRGGGGFHPSRGSGGRHQHDGHHGHQRRGGIPHRHFFPAFVSPSVVVTSPVLVAPGPFYAAPPIYAAPPVYYAPAPAYAAPPAVAPSPVPRVVEFPTGRYELRGDGVTSPYVWVWIPNPPAAPPPPPAPAAPPAEAPDPGASRRAPAQAVAVYRWTDEDGVTTWTDSLEKVPARFRPQASRSARTP